MSESSVTRQGVMRGGAWVLLTRVVTAVVGVALYALLARVLSQEDVGSYFAVTTVAAFLGGLGTLGVGKAVIRFIGEIDTGEPGDRRGVLRRSIQIAGISGLLLGSVMLVATQIRWWEDQAWTAYAAVTAALVVVGTLRFLLPDHLRAFADVKNAAILGMAYPKIAITAFLGVAFIVGSGLAATTLLWFVVGVWASIVVIGVVAVRRRLPPPVGGHVPNTLSFLSIGVPFLSILLGAFATTQIGVIAVAAIEGVSEAALYGAAWNLAVWVAVPQSIVIATIQPYVVRLWSAGEMQRLEKLMRQAATGAGLLALAGFVGLAILGRPILEILFGPSYADGYGILVVLAFGQVFTVVTGASLVLLGLTGRQRWVLVLNVVVAPIAIALTLAMTAVAGALGGAIAGTIAVVALNVAGSVVVYRTMRIKTWAEASLDFLRGANSIMR